MPILSLTVQEFRECLVQAGQMRLPPIAETTLTTIGGLLPLAIAGGPLWEGMSWLMIFGLTVPTLLTLIFIPLLYAIFVENFKMSPIPKPLLTIPFRSKNTDVNSELPSSFSDTKI